MAIRSGAVISLGAATLADIYEPSQRGTMMGIYYSAPLLGPSLGPILGGALTQAFSRRATFWFLAIFVGICFLSFIPFRDTFRRERSLTYQTALRRRRALLLAKDSAASSVSQLTSVSRPVAPTSDAPTPDAPVPAAPAPAALKGKSNDPTRDAIEELARGKDIEKQVHSASAAPAGAAAPMDDVKLTSQT